jgi:hypothetical protein
MFTCLGILIAVGLALGLFDARVDERSTRHRPTR